MDELINMYNTFFETTKYENVVRKCVSDVSHSWNEEEDVIANKFIDSLDIEVNRCLSFAHNKTLFDYQQKAVNHFYTNRGLITAFATGTGKTLTAVSTASCIHNLSSAMGVPCKVLVVTPASLVKNMKKAFKDHSYKIGKDLNVVSSNAFRDALLYKFYKEDPKRFLGTQKAYESFMRNAEKKSSVIKCTKRTFLIIDEAHEFKTDFFFVFARSLFGPPLPVKDVRSRAMALISLCSSHIWKVMLMTATPMLNKWHDIMNLIAVVKNVHTTNQKNFIREELKTVKTNSVIKTVTGFDEVTVNIPTIVNRDYFRDVIMFKEVDPASKDFPQKNQKFVTIVMTAKYYQKVKKVIMDFKTVQARGRRRRGGDEDDDIDRLQTLIAKIEGNPKIPYIQRLIKSKKYNKILVYSRFLIPLEVAKKEIDKSMPHGWQSFVITGKAVPVHKRQEFLEQINDSDKAIIYISDAGGVGLYFKGIEAVIIYEPGIHISAEEQAIGRAVRFRSHLHLPEEKQRVDALKLVSVYPPGVVEDEPTPDQKAVLRNYKKKLESVTFKAQLLKLNSM